MRLANPMMRILPLLLLTLLAAPACGDDDGGVISSHAYKGHENDLDVYNFVNEYPDTVGTRLDDCQTCHTGGSFTYDRGGGDIRTASLNACDYCHLIIHPNTDYIEAQPTTYAETLNPYGADYVAAGRNRAALRAIAGDDSDGDGYANGDEIDAIRYPGDPDSMPGQQVAPSLEYTELDLQGLTSHEQFLLSNSHKQEYDNYSTFVGVKIRDLLLDAGVVLDGSVISGITVIAPDGYLKDFTFDEIVNPYPAGLYYAGMDSDTLGTECGFVTYPDVLPEGLTDGGEIPGEQWLMLAYERDGLPLDESNLDITSGKINGEGPFRIVVPQSVPGMPDRGSSYSPPPVPTATTTTTTTITTPVTWCGAWWPSASTPCPMGTRTSTTTTAAGPTSRATRC